MPSWRRSIDFLEKHRVIIIVGTILVAVAGLPLLYFMKFDFNPINLRNTNVEVDRDLPRSAQGSEHRRQRHQRDDEFGSRRQEDRGEAGEGAGSASRDVAGQFCAGRSAGQAEADRAGAPRCSSPRSIRIRSMRAPTDEENVEALKSSVDSLRKTAGDGKGAGRGRRRGGWPTRCRSSPNPIRRRATRRRRFSSRR